MSVVVQEIECTITELCIELVNEHDQEVGEVIEQLQDIRHCQRNQVQIGRVDLAFAVHDYDKYIAQDAKGADDREQINARYLAHDLVEPLVVFRGRRIIYA